MQVSAPAYTVIIEWILLNFPWGIGNAYEARHENSKDGCVGLYFAVAFELRPRPIFGSNHHANVHRDLHNHPHADALSYADTLPDNHSHADALTNGDPLAVAGRISDHVRQ